MRLQIFSDVHFDVADVWQPVLAPGADAVIVAGDVCEGLARGIGWLRRHLGAEVPIVLVAGNHEYFGTEQSAELASGRAAARAHGVHLLEDDEVVVGGVRFIGATLWTDFDLYGRDRRSDAMATAHRFMVDHRLVRQASGEPFTPADARDSHIAARLAIERRLGVPHAGATVVVTHHAPHRLSLADRYRDDMLSAAFVSDLSALIEERQPALWVHGHTHTSFDYRVGRSRILCNPHGYGSENPAFEPGLIVTV